MVARTCHAPRHGSLPSHPLYLLPHQHGSDHEPLIVPPDSVIKTFSHLKGDRIDFVLSQDNEGLAGGSMVIRAGEWAKFFLDSWFDPLYRSYNFQKAEAHALEHIVQCVHPLFEYFSTQANRAPTDGTARS
jgi:hypothetical protein